MTNTEIVMQVFLDYANNNMAELLGRFSNDCVWIEPGAPDVPFAGTYKGKQGIMEMFGKEIRMLKVTNFEPSVFLASETQVAVLGNDSADVLSTGKSYSTDWTMVFTIGNGLITKVQVYMDTNAVAKAFIA